MELWKNHPEFGQYLISSLGRVSRYGKLRKLQLDSDGYLRCTLAKKSETRRCGVHRLVLETFVGPCPKGLQAAHLNGVRADNRLENLAWCTALENNHHRKIHGTLKCGEQLPQTKVPDFDAKMIKTLWASGLFTQAELSIRFNTPQPNISWIVNGKRRNV